MPWTTFTDLLKASPGMHSEISIAQRHSTCVRTNKSLKNATETNKYPKDPHQ